MRNTSPTGLHLCLLLTLSILTIHASAAERKEGPWSDPSYGLRARLVLVEKLSDSGALRLVPYLQLTNISNCLDDLEIILRGHIELDVVTADGRPFEGHLSKARSGPMREFSTVILPI